MAVVKGIAFQGLQHGSRTLDFIVRREFSVGGRVGKYALAGGIFGVSVVGFSP